MNERHAIYLCLDDRHDDGSVFACLCGARFPMFGVAADNLSRNGDTPLWHLAFVDTDITGDEPNDSW